MARQPKTNTLVNGYNYYRTVLTIGYDIDGNPIKKQFYGKSKTESENKKKEYLKTLESGVNPDLASQTLERSMKTWLWEIEYGSSNKSSSFERYESIFRNYIQGTEFGHLKLNDIKKLSIQKHYNVLSDAGKSNSILINLNKLLSKFFIYAESEQYIIKNPVKGFKINKSNEQDIEEEDKIVETFTQDEINRILAVANPKLKYLIEFALLTGIRQGEILALNRTDIRNKIVKITKSVRTIKVYETEEKYHYEIKATKPKTKSSRREVPLPYALIEEIEKLFLLLNEERLKLGPAYVENTLLFPSLTGTYMDAKNLRRSWERALITAKVPHKKFHSLRHTYATRLFENGVSILTVSRLLGHSSIRTTEIYTHVLEDIKQRDVQCLNDLII